MFHACCGTTLPADPPTSQNEATNRVQQKMRQLVDHDQVLPGIQHVVVDSQEIISEIHFGYLDKGGREDNDGLLQQRRSVEASTYFMTYSITKIVTSIAVFQLVQRKLIHLDEPLSSYFSNHPYGNHITIRMLLNHTAGIPNPIPADWFVVVDDHSNEHDKTPLLDIREQALQRIIQKHPTLTSEPGTRSGYSNIGYWLLEKAVESVSGQRFDEYVQQYIFQPLAVTEASFSLPSSLDNMARGHMRKYSLVNAMFWFLAPNHYWIEASKDGTWSRFAHLQHLGLGYGGLYASAGALATILQDLLKMEDEASILLRAETKEVFFTNGGWVSGTTESYNVYGLRTMIPYYSKPGGGLGFHGNVRIYPTLGIASVFLTNASEVSPGPILSRATTLDTPFVDWKAKGALL